MMLKTHITLLITFLSINFTFGRYETVPKTQLDQLRHDFLLLEPELWELNDLIKETNHPELELIKRFKYFDDSMQMLFLQELKDDDVTSKISKFALIYSDLRSIYAMYEMFRRFQTQQTQIGHISSPKQAWIDIANEILGKSSHTNVTKTLENLNEIINATNFYKNVRREVHSDILCNSQQSPQQILYNLHNTIALTSLKGYTMVQFSYMLLRLYNEGNFTNESQILRKRYQERLNIEIDAIRNAMQSSSTELWRCDPKKHTEPATYLQITELLQGYIQNEVDLNTDQTCRENCAEYRYTKANSCYKELYCAKQRRCNGKIINCKFVDSDMWVCPSSVMTNRRYEYIEYENGRTLGRKLSCPRGTTKVDSWWRWLFWHCSYCFCLCDEQGPQSDRYFNMRPTVTNLTENKVVTGLRFVKKNRIIHLQVQEGKLLPRGTIDPNSLHWIPVDDYKITDRDVYNDRDYRTLSWEKRAVDLDDLKTNDGYLLTGVRFKAIGSHLNFEIYMTAFDFESGRLVPEKSQWKDNPNTDSSLNRPRIRVNYSNPDIPTRTISPSIPDSKTDQYIEFRETDMDKDASQTTVPFIDAQDVTPMNPVPLSGAGIHHKGQPGFGGFLAAKIFTYDFSKHLSAAFPEQEEAALEDALVN